MGGTVMRDERLMGRKEPTAVYGSGSLLGITLIVVRAARPLLTHEHHSLDSPRFGLLFVPQKAVA